MFPSVILVVLSVAAVSFGYEFNDPTFNEILVQNFLSYSQLSDDSQLHYRERRELSEPNCKPHGLHFDKICCEESFCNETAHDQAKEMAKECFAEIGQKLKNEKVEHHTLSDFLTCEGLKRGKNEIACAINCVGQKMNFLDDLGNLNKDHIRSEMPAHCFGPQWAKTAAVPAIEKCIDIVAEYAFDAPKADGTCNKSGMKFAHCLFKEMSLSCPADKQKGTPKCNKIRDRLTKGEDLIQIKDFHQNH